MLNNISKILTGDILKILSDMGHGDYLIIADANFPGETIAKSTTVGHVVRIATDAVTFLDSIVDLFPIDVKYSGDKAACVMELTDGDKASGMPTPAIFSEYEKVMGKRYPGIKVSGIERFSFYEKAKGAYAVIETGEERVYGNLLIVKGVVL